MIIKLGVYLILTVAGLLLFKIGGNNNQIVMNINKINVNISVLSLMGIICYGGSFLLWLSIIKNNNLSYIFPIANSLVTVFTVLSGMIFLNEKIQAVQIIGIVMIIIGTFIINNFK